METKTQNKKVDLGNILVGEMDLPTLDLTKYVGKKVKIEKAEIQEGPHGYYLHVGTEIIDRLKGKDGEIQLRASRNFGLQKNEEGQIGWGKDTNLGVFLQKMKVNHLPGQQALKNLIGKEVIIQTVTNNEKKKDFLSFN